MNVLTRGARNAFRNGIRTSSIVLILGLAIGLALSMQLARQAVDAKIQSVKSSIGNTISVSPAGMRGFDGGGEPLTSQQIKQLETLAHVSNVSAVLSDHLITDESTNLKSSVEPGSLGKRFSGGGEAKGPVLQLRDGSGNVTTKLPIIVTGTDNPKNLQNIGDVNLQDGTFFAGDSTENVALVGAGLAKKNNLSVGSTFTAYNKTITVTGIINTDGNRFADNVVAMPLASLQKLSGQANTVTSATITVDSIENIDSVVSAAKQKLGDTADVVSQQDSSKEALAPLEGIKGVSLFALVSAIVAGAVIILLTMVMIVRERRREVGVLKAIGASNAKVSGQFIVEATVLTMMAVVVGLVVSIATAGPITKSLVQGAQSANVSPGTGRAMGAGGAMRIGPAGPMQAGLQNINEVTATISWQVVLYGIGFALLIALAGSAAASWFITKIRPAEAVRAE